MEKPKFDGCALGTRGRRPAGCGRRPRPARLATGLGVVVFSNDNEVIDTVQKAVRGRLPVYSASNIVQVVKVLTEHGPACS